MSARPPRVRSPGNKKSSFSSEGSSFSRKNHHFTLKNHHFQKTARSAGHGSASQNGTCKRTSDRASCKTHHCKYKDSSFLIHNSSFLNTNFLVLNTKLLIFTHITRKSNPNSNANPTFHQNLYFNTKFRIFNAKSHHFECKIYQSINANADLVPTPGNVMMHNLDSKSGANCGFCLLCVLYIFLYVYCTYSPE